MPKALMQGDNAIAEAAKKAGLDFFAAYPITPASEILQNIANSYVPMVQAEDELASINMAIGASLAGKKSMVASSGPGMSLKQESIGLAHMLEAPLVIVNVQRVGPSTGMPTMGSQQDIMQVKYGPHGDIFPIAFYPNSVEECYKLTFEAFNAAEEAMIPVTLLCDGIIGHLYESIDFSKIKIPRLKKRKRKPLGQIGDAKHFTGLLSTEKGELRTKDHKFYRKWIKERKLHVEKIAAKYAFYEYFGNKKSDTLLIAYGISSRVISPLQDKYAIFRPIRIWPVLEKEFLEISRNHKKLVIIEMNNGQYQKELMSVCKRDIKLISQQGGKISLEEIKKRLRQI